MAELASLQIKVVRDGIEQAQKALNDLSKAADSAEKSAGGVGKGFEDAGKKTKGFNSDIMSLAKFVGGAVIAKGFYEIGSAALKAAANMEQQKVAFTTMLGSAERANSLLRDMQEFAGSTPFSFNEVVDAGKRLVAFGFEADSVVGNLRMLGDVSAGLSQPVGDMVYLFGQIKTQGRAMTQDLMQFANRGVPIYDELAKVLGVSTSQVKEFASQGKIGFAEIEQVFKNMTAEGGKFGGLMDAQSKTLSGKWSNFGDNLDRIAVTLGDKMAPAASSFLDLLIRITESDMSQTQREMDDIVNKTQELLKYEEQYGVEKMNQSGFKDDLIYMERMKGIHIDINKSAKERLEIYKGITDAIKAATTEEVLYSNNAHDKAMKAKYGNKEIPKSESGKTGSGKSSYNYASELEHAREMTLANVDESVRVTAKFNEEMDRLKVLQNYTKAGSANEVTVFNAQAEATRKYRKEMEKLADAADGFSLAMADIGKQLANTSVYAAAEGFEKIGEAWGKGEMSGKAFKKIMAEALWQVISAIPMMFVAAGLQMLIASGGTNPLGYAFIAAGMAGQIGVGYVNGKVAAEEEKSAHGNVYGFAQGGTFTNEIVNSPTRFMFSRGGTTGRGLMGEAGTEAVVPLRRMSNGNLGVESSGGGGEVNVNIVNASGEKVGVERKSNGSGSDITVTIGNVIAKGILDGTFDKQLKARYGTSRRGV